MNCKTTRGRKILNQPGYIKKSTSAQTLVMRDLVAAQFEKKPKIEARVKHAQNQEHDNYSVEKSPSPRTADDPSRLLQTKACITLSRPSADSTGPCLLISSFQPLSDRSVSLARIGMPTAIVSGQLSMFMPSQTLLTIIIRRHFSLPYITFTKDTPF